MFMHLVFYIEINIAISKEISIDFNFVENEIIKNACNN